MDGNACKCSRVIKTSLLLWSNWKQIRSQAVTNVDLYEHNQGAEYNYFTLPKFQQLYENG